MSDSPAPASSPGQHVDRAARRAAARGPRYLPRGGRHVARRPIALPLTSRRLAPVAAPAGVLLVATAVAAVGLPGQDDPAAPAARTGATADAAPPQARQLPSATGVSLAPASLRTVAATVATTAPERPAPEPAPRHRAATAEEPRATTTTGGGHRAGGPAATEPTRPAAPSAPAPAPTAAAQPQTTAPATPAADAAATTAPGGLVGGLVGGVVGTVGGVLDGVLNPTAP